MTTRKMILVPERTMEELKQWRERSLQPLPHTAEVASSVRLGNELDAIADREDLTPEAKVAKFGQELHRYRTYLQQARHPEDQKTWSKKMEEVKEIKADDDVKTELSQGDQDLMTAISASVTAPLKPKVPLLLKHLKKHSDILTWEKDGQIQYKGKTIPGTNMIDLVTDALRPQPRKGYQPSGLSSFVKGLVESNVPRDWIRNPNYIKVMNQPVVKPKAVSTPKGQHDTDEDDTGFFDAVPTLTSNDIKDTTETPLSQKMGKDWQRLTPSVFSTIKHSRQKSHLPGWIKNQNLRKMQD